MANEKVQVRERAGLEEARLNQELVDFLRGKTFTYLCVALAVGALGFSGLRKYREIERQKVAAAFTEFDQATSIEDPSPDALERIAEAYADIGSIGPQARLAAADAHLRVVRIGAKPGVVTGQDGEIAAEDQLGAEDRKQHLDRAADLYQLVLTQSQGVQGKMLQTLQALYGLAATAECRRDLDAAKKFYEQIVAMTEKGTFGAQAIIAQNRIAALATLSDPKLLSREDLPWLFPKNPTVVSPNATPDQTGPNASPALPLGPIAPDAPPTDAKPADAPADTKPADPAPAAAPAEKPQETKPQEPKPEEVKPAEPAPTNPK